jgi:hypothetical protein
MEREVDRPNSNPNDDCPVSPNGPFWYTTGGFIRGLRAFVGSIFDDDEIETMTEPRSSAPFFIRYGSPSQLVPDMKQKEPELPLRAKYSLPDVAFACSMIFLAVVEVITTLAIGWQQICSSVVLKVAIVPLYAVSLLAVDAAGISAFSAMIGLVAMAICAASLGTAMACGDGKRDAKLFFAIGTCSAHVVAGTYVFVRSVLSKGLSSGGGERQVGGRSQSEVATVSWSLVHAAVLFSAFVSTSTWSPTGIVRIVYSSILAVTFFFPVASMCVWNTDVGAPVRWAVGTAAFASLLGQFAVGVGLRMAIGTGGQAEVNLFGTICSYLVSVASALSCLPLVLTPFFRAIRNRPRLVSMISGTTTTTPRR